MTKRFTECEKWDDEWFDGLSNEMKLFWLYLCDNCNHAGIWKVNKRLVEYHIKGLCWENIEKEFNGRILPINNEKWFIKKFIDFQYPRGLSKHFDSHRSVINILNQHNLSSYVSFMSKSRMKEVSMIHESCNKDKDKDKDKDKEGVVNKGELGKTEQNISPTNIFISYFNVKTKGHFRVTKNKVDLVNSRLKEGFTIEDMKRAVDNFIQDPWEDRHRFMDPVYCIGIIRKIDMLQKWLNFKLDKADALTGKQKLEQIMKGGITCLKK
jgi:uncharacterized phage protein (TIGR02220 family)